MGRVKVLRYKRAIALRLDDELWDAIEELARGEERSLGGMARILLREAMENRGGEKEKGKKPAERKR